MWIQMTVLHLRLRIQVLDRDLRSAGTSGSHVPAVPYDERKKDQSLVFRDALCMRNGLFLIWSCHGSWLERF